MKAANNIKMQQSISLNTKLRRPSNFEGDIVLNKKRESASKRKKSARSSSDEDTSQGPTKHSKTEEKNETLLKKITNVNSQNHSPVIAHTIEQEKNELSSSIRTRSSSRKRTFSQSENMKNKKSNNIDDTLIAPITNDIDEPSMYEDAIGKPTPIMNSTMNFNSTFTTQKIMNATVVLEPLSAVKLNETVTIKKTSDNNIRNSNEQKAVEMKTEFRTTFKVPSSPSPSSMALQYRMQQLKQAMVNKEFDELLTEDESSPEVKKPKANIKKQEIRKRQKRLNNSTTSSDDGIPNTPAKPTLKEINTIINTGFQEMRNTYKSNALFSPYAKESVKKRVEAFEQVGMNSPKPVVDIDIPTRITRTKTRARAAAQAEALENMNIAEKTVAHKLARKSLAKAKKISLAKQNKDVDEHKENKLQSAQKIKIISMEKINYKQQQKATPLTKTKTQLPLSVNRIPHTPSNQINTNNNKPLSAVRSNIITSVESLIQAPKSVNKRNSLDKIDEKKRKLNEEDARKKREEALRLQTEEKRRKRQEKELRNKLAREAKEKQDMEKRQKAEKEREEKARLAQQLQEKQREEMEKKRLAQLQRAQEKEERRKQEEQLRLQRLQEQEEAERILAEQRRREQEAERRKEAELRTQQQAAIEAMKAKNQMLAQTKYGSKYNGPTTYILDSEPDDDDSDDETKPKHIIPYWAQSQVRKTQLAIQRYIPEKAVFKFFDTRKCTPDLTQLFHGIDRNKLKRTSSAIWKTPPRYSMMETE
ncbi:abhydrolase domain-containing protein [Apis mellifera caucasica]|nr:abhydrolase domain-containing protein [Apis mellifera caucasica]KAG9436436.1 abhydrolase domain-containing protein [Apis mellifera carnica]